MVENDGDLVPMPRAIFMWSLNIFSGVSIVMVNKKLMGAAVPPLVSSFGVPQFFWWSNLLADVCILVFRHSFAQQLVDGLGRFGKTNNADPPLH